MGKEAISSKQNGNFTHVTPDTTISSIINNPSFNGFGKLIFPIKNCINEYDQNMRIENINSLLPYHNNVNVNTTVNVINYLLDEVKYGKTIFYNYYSDTQRQNDKNKEATGLFFFKGNPGAPFAVICAGGGFSYVGSIHESFPYAIELSKKGYNAFSIEYRVGGGEQAATEDLAAAISFIFRNAAELEVSINNYSVWGASAGAKMTANIGSNGVQAYGGDSVHKPSVVIMQYKRHPYPSLNNPPIFAVVGENDPISSAMEKSINNLRNIGVDTEFYKYSNVDHGFGLGIGMSAEGWINNAIKFWEKYIER
jgi:acetyl esterase/lipase